MFQYELQYIKIYLEIKFKISELYNAKNLVNLMVYNVFVLFRA